MATQYRIVGKDDGWFYPQTKGWFCWGNFYRCIQYELVEVVRFQTHEGASAFLQQKFDERKPKVKYPKAIYPWTPKP